TVSPTGECGILTLAYPCSLTYPFPLGHVFKSPSVFPSNLTEEQLPNNLSRISLGIVTRCLERTKQDNFCVVVTGILLIFRLYSIYCPFEIPSYSATPSI